MPLEIENEIYKSIKQAIMEQKLRPNMQLVEEVIAESFGVSRTPVRNVVRRLAGEKLVTIIPYRGAFVSCPSIQEAKEVFETRRVIEEAAIRKACLYMNEERYGRLKELLDDEDKAQHEGDILGAIRVTGDFHLLLAEVSGNSYYARYLEELVSLTYVVIALYGEQKHKSCKDHRDILEAIREGDAEEAVRLMMEHLGEIEAALRFDQTEDRSLSLADIFRSDRLVANRR
ncbi:GntR family transcriptional regulator [Cohnella sp. AR92]|uniref:GntR family transcriptional regulator n=1 Tax=Cohnella sp. AR92 TaxID=648716 RepID=UPI000F8F2006|nr:GntR family transcriptional regulator [Cohnella sp. AR92]RUS46030.1 GntR family transcriptional regulator [Cohnella sp. AR92]